MKRRNGFSLIELLVLVGIVSVLLAILLPAVQVASTQSYVAQCASRMQQFGAATFNYAADNHDYLPPWKEQTYTPLRERFGGTLGAFGCVPAGVPNIIANPVTDYNLYWGSALGTNHLRLYCTGYLGSWHWVVPSGPYAGFNCPSREGLFLMGFGTPSQPVPLSIPQTCPGPLYDSNFFPLRWDPANQGTMTPAGNELNTDYLFNPHWAYINTSAFQIWATTPQGFKGLSPPTNVIMDNQPITCQFAKLSQYNSKLALASDMIYDPASTAHPVGKGQADFNLLYPDGHVQTVLDSYVMQGFNFQDSRGVGRQGSQGSFELGPVDKNGWVMFGKPGSGQPIGDLPVTSDSASVGAGIAAGVGVSTADNCMWLLDDYLDILETEAQGQNPLTNDLFGPVPIGLGQAHPLVHREAIYKGWDSGSEFSNKGNKITVNFW